MRKAIIILLIMMITIFAACQKKESPPIDTEVSQSTSINSETSFTTITSQITTIQTTSSTTVETKPETTIESSVTETQSTTKETTPQIVLSTFFALPDTSVRPVAVMIDNEGYNSYPQGGIDKAQIVYELIAEYGETRLMPVFFGLDKGNIGPVRSARHYFIQYAMEYDPVLVHIGFSPQAQSMIKKNSLASVNGLYSDHYIFFDITKDKNNWQDSYTKFEYIKQNLKDMGYRVEPVKPFPFIYSATKLAGADARSISLKYSSGYNVSYKYDDDTGLYLRIRKGSYHIDRYTGKVLTAKNIIIMKVVTYPIKNDTAGRMTMDNVGNGTGYYVTQGKYEEITWEKTSEFAQTEYKYKDSGENITLNEGQTWIMVMSEQAAINIK